MNDFLNYGKHWIDDDDIASVADVLKSDFLTQGPKIGEFEKIYADYVGATYAVAVSNGTAALHLAVSALDIDAGKRGITCPNTFAASANCFVYNNLKPGFADIDAKTYCMDADELEKQLTPDTAVVIPVHFAGQPCNMEKITRVIQKQLTPPYIIEDASHAIGTTYENGLRVGSCCHCDMTIFSFHPVKTIATGEGGMITTNNRTLYEKLIRRRTHGITKNASELKIHDPEIVGPWYYEMQDLGFNYRLTDIQAGLGISQMRKIDLFTTRRRQIVDRYNEAFRHIDFLTLPYEREGVRSVFHLYVIKIDFKGIGKTRTQVMGELRAKGIGTQVHYIPVHLQPYYRENYGFKPGDFPNAEQYYEQCLSIPLYPKMTDEDVDRVIEIIKRIK
ncbi:MAG: UDP-4-amino-4,6-dideoxy-N-acetyl-beta-L-altrosamine transaminase [Candidatus Omnitrophota bacterium]